MSLTLNSVDKRSNHFYHFHSANQFIFSLRSPVVNLNTLLELLILPFKLTI